MSDFNTVESLEGVSDDTDLDQFSSDFFGKNEDEEAPAKDSAEEDKADDAPTDTQLEDDTPAEETSEEAEEGDNAPEPKKTRLQKRIDDLNGKWRQEQREKEDLQRRLDEALSGKQNVEPKTAAAEKTDGPSPDDVKEDGTDKYPLGEFDPAYIRDLTRFTIKQERDAQEARQAEAAQQNAVTEAQQALVDEWNTKLPAALEKYDDFKERGQELIDELGDLDPAYGSYLTETLMSMEFGTDVLYHLATHPDEAREIVDSGARLATIKLGRLESRFAKGEEVPERRVSKAPPPPPTNKGSAVAKAEPAPDTDSLADFEKLFFKKRG